jgi:hypothetical protein
MFLLKIRVLYEQAIKKIKVGAANCKPVFLAIFVVKHCNLAKNSRRNSEPPICYNTGGLKFTEVF